VPDASVAADAASLFNDRDEIEQMRGEPTGQCVGAERGLVDRAMFARFDLIDGSRECGRQAFAWWRCVARHRSYFCCCSVPSAADGVPRDGGRGRRRCGCTGQWLTSDHARRTAARPVHPHVAARAHRPAELRPQQKEQKTAAEIRPVDARRSATTRSCRPALREPSIKSESREHSSDQQPPLRGQRTGPSGSPRICSISSRSLNKDAASAATDASGTQFHQPRQHRVWKPEPIVRFERHPDQ